MRHNRLSGRQSNSKEADIKLWKVGFLSPSILRVGFLKVYPKTVGFFMVVFFMVGFFMIPVSTVMHMVFFTLLLFSYTNEQELCS